MAEGKDHNKHADIVFFGGDIVTMDESNPNAEALAVQDGKIDAVGSLKHVFKHVGSKTKVIYLNQQALMPGLIEAHQHAVLAALNNFMYTDISGYKYTTAEEVLKVITDEVNAATDGWCVFMGWDPELVSDLPKLSATYLDEISKTIPIMIIAQNGHSAWVNNKAFEVSDSKPPPPPDDAQIVVDENGERTGQLLEEPAIKYMLSYAPQPTAEELRHEIDEQWYDYAKRGFTTVTEMAYTPSPELDMILQAKASEDDCPIRLALYKVGQTQISVKNTEKLWLAGAKYWADGSPHAGSMAVREPYLKSAITEVLSFPEPPDNYGHLNWDTEELLEEVRSCHDEGLQVSIHANGERAVEQGLTVYRQLPVSATDDRRHRLEHMGLGTDAQLAECARLGVAPSMFVFQLYYYATSFRDFILGEERTNRYAALSLAIKHGSRLSIHQDNPNMVGPPEPFANMKTAITRTQRDNSEVVFGPEYRINIDEAVKAYTTGPAWQLFREHELGSLEVGKLADLVVLSANPYKVPPENLEDIKVVETYLAGHCNGISKTHVLTKETVKCFTKH